jgi:predicted ester cyclase
MKNSIREHFEDFVNQRNAAVIRKNMTPDFYDHDGPGGKPTGVDGDEQMMIAMYRSMPNLHLQIEHMIAGNDKVMCRKRLAVDRLNVGTEDAVSWFCAVALRGRQNRRTVGHSRSAGQGNVVDEDPNNRSDAKFPLRNGKNHEGTAAQSTWKLIAAYLDAMMQLAPTQNIIRIGALPLGSLRLPCTMGKT